MKRAIAPYRELILLALDQLEEYKPATKEEFLRSRLLQDGILLQLIQVGENLARIRDVAPAKFELAPKSWSSIIGLRNLAAHEYWRIDPDRVWSYLDEDLADFRQTIEELED